jgi:hypothetical protein
MFTDINSEDRLVQKTFADYLHDTLGWDSVYAWNEETFGPAGNLGRDQDNCLRPASPFSLSPFSLSKTASRPEFGTCDGTSSENLVPNNYCLSPVGIPKSW